MHGKVEPPKATGSGPKGKLTAKESMARRKLLKGIEDEKHLGEWITGDLIPRVEKEEARVARVRKKMAESIRNMQAAELRSTRTRRSTRKIDYTYDSFDEVS